tara:strand:- start:1423 stop:2796 length:1374 start_codon:yes stop_codon:yes gene_type:complete
MMRTESLPCFKALDVRGRIPDQLNEDLAYKIGQAYAQVTGSKKVVVGYDIRLSSPGMARALSEGLRHQGVNVIDIGLGGTEMVYFGAFHLEEEGVDGGLMVTASHNPADYNGIKFVKAGARPISKDNGLLEIEQAAMKDDFAQSEQPGTLESHDLMPEYIAHLLQYVDIEKIKPLKVVTNPGHGGAGLVIDQLEKHLPIEFIKIQHDPDGHFPCGIPNPLLPDNRAATAQAVLEHGADLGIAWDGDFDRCFFFDAAGQFIEGYYLVGMLAQAMLSKHPGEAVIYEPRLTWNTLELVSQAGGRPVLCKTGHAFIKERMRAEDALYGGEMSAHHYFRDFAYCDSGQIPWLLVAQLLSETGQSLSDMVNERLGLFPTSGEINRTIADADKSIEAVRAVYASQALHQDTTDGFSFEFESWRFNLRKSNTEPLVRLNVETRGDAELLDEKTREVLQVLDGAS